MTSFVFPGQGSQYLNMARDFHDNFKIAKDTFQEIEEYSSINLRKLIFSDDDTLLNQTRYTQISIFASSLTIFNTLSNLNLINTADINFMLGHSLGEYSALACSNKISVREASIILKKRGDIMQNALEKNKYGMAALIGLSVLEIEKIINENNMNLQIANDNSPIQVVISGKIEDLIKYENSFKSKNVKKFIKLNVSSAFHSSYMINAQNELNKDIENLKFQNNNIKIISNFNAEILNDNNSIKLALKNQMSNKVRWTESIKNLENTNDKKIIEIGPGKVLSGLIKRISDKFDIKTYNKIDDLNE